MKRISLSSLAVLTLVLLVSAYSRTTQSSKTAGVTTQTIASQPTQPAKAKKVLVRELPKTLEGITLDNGVLRLKSGYKFVPQLNNTVAVALQAGGAGVKGSFDCFCSKEGGGGCSAKTVGGTISCAKSKEKGCSDDCILITTVDGLKTRLAIY